ncbi:MAG: hypothetical protein ACQERC_02360 [Bacteroidota bacterium]
MTEKSTYYCEKCKNTIPKGKYCPDCGVHNSGEKSSLKKIFKDIFAQVFSVEKGIIHNFTLTFSHPHILIWSYYKGIRNKFAAPGKFLLYALLILGTLYLINPNIGFLKLTLEGEIQTPVNGNKFFLIFIIPLLTITSKIVFWRRIKGLTLHIIAVIYLFIPRFVIASLIIALFDLTIGQHWVQSLISSLIMLHTFWANVAVQKDQPGVLQKLGYTLLQLIVLLGLILVLALLVIASLQIDVSIN